MQMAFWPILGGLAGLIAGSFLATLVLRWPLGLRLSGRSRCDNCGATLSAQDLVPLLSYAITGGKCRHCGGQIDPLHPLIEFSCAVAGVLALLALPAPWGFTGALLGWILVALIALDTRHFWLPDALTLPLLGLGLALGPGAFTTRLLSAAIGGGTFFLIALLFRWLRKKEGMGMGDVKLMAALGAWINPQFLPPLLLVAALIGLISAGFSALRGRKSGAKSQPEMRVAFGACLAVAAFPIWLLAAATDNMEHRRQALETNHLAPYRLTIIDEPGHAKAPPKSPTMRGRIIVKTAATAGPHPTAGRIPPCR